MRIVFHLAFNSKAQADKVGLLRKIILQSKLPFAPARQNPRMPRLAYGPSVKQGLFAQREYADIYLLERCSTQEVRSRLEDSKPAEVTILEVKRVPYAMAGVQQLAGVAQYRVKGDFTAHGPKQSIENYVSSPRMETAFEAPNGMRISKDIKPFVRSAHSLGPEEVELYLNRVGEKWISPLEVIYAWLGIQSPALQETDERFTIIRQGLYWQDSQGNLHLI